MKILEINAMRGPNYWSVSRHKLIVMRLDIGELEERPTDTIRGFGSRLEKLFPGMHEHYCSKGRPGGFFERVQEGTWMGHVVEHIALELQTLAGMQCSFGRTRGTGTRGIYNVILEYTEEACGKYAAKAAVRIAEALVSGSRYDIGRDIDELCALREECALGPSTAAIVEEAVKRGIPVTRLGSASRILLGHGVHQKKMEATIAGTTSSIAVELACNKAETKIVLNDAGIPVPTGVAVKHISELEDAVRELGFPVVVKPVDGNHGKGATINIATLSQAREAFQAASRFSAKVLVERYIKGFDFRFLVINYKLVAVAKRTPASVIGDGVSTIRQLIDRENCNPERGTGHDKVLTKIIIDDSTHDVLAERGLSLRSVAKRDEVVYLKHTANLSTGGTSTDVTDLVHPHNAALAERIARIVGLDICGIDIMAPDIETPLSKNGGAVLEVNAAPGLRMHLAPSEGTPRNVAGPILDMLFPGDAPSSVPLVAVTGTNGKTTTTRLLAHMAKTVGFKTGFVTTDGIYVNDQLVRSGDCTGPKSAETLLSDPGVEFAVLECARGGILRSGLGFSKSDIGIVTNVAADHLGIKDIETLDDMAHVKSVIAESVAEEGYAILNADDDLVYGMRERVKSNVALFSLKADNPRIRSHCKEGGIAVSIEKGCIVVFDGKRKINYGDVKSIPLAFGGAATFMVQNIMAAVAAGHVSGFPVESVKEALATFIPSPQLTPGRMNIFEFGDFSVLLDYAHNAAGLEALGDFLDRSGAKTKVGVITGVGDRRDRDIIEIGERAARMFDEIVIRMDSEMRGRSYDDMASLIREGIEVVDPRMPVKVIPDIAAAIKYAVANASKGTIITVCCEKVNETIDIITDIQSAYEVKAVAGSRWAGGAVHPSEGAPRTNGALEKPKKATRSAY